MVGFLIKKFGFEKVYKDGLNIKTPLSLELQSSSTLALRKGLLNYDKRKGWRGALLNKKYNKKWTDNLDNFVLEKSINWDLAIVKNISDTKIEIETKDSNKGLISQNYITWIKKSSNH